jgi:hypothetical protein
LKLSTELGEEDEGLAIFFCLQELELSAGYLWMSMPRIPWANDEVRELELRPAICCVKVHGSGPTFGERRCTYLLTLTVHTFLDVWGEPAFHAPGY